MGRGMTVPDFDCIVIGSGIGGLTAAATLSGRGVKVLVLEKNSVSGGYLQSFRRKGFQFDSCVDCFSGLDKDGPIRAALDSVGQTGNLDFIRLDPIRLSIFPDIRIKVHADVNEYISSLSAIFPHEAGGIKSFFDVMQLIYSDIKAWGDGLTGMLRNGRSRGQRREQALPLNVMKYSAATFADLLNAHVGDPFLKAVLSDRCPFYGLPPSRVGAVAMTALMMSYFSSGAYRVRGGTQELADTLVRGIVNKGGTVMYNREVTGIITEEGRAEAVKTTDGTEYTARHVISNIDYRKTMQVLINAEEFTDKKVSRSQTRVRGLARDLPEPSSSFFILYVGADVDLKHLGGASSIGYFPTKNMEYNFSSEAAFAPDGFIGITIPSLLDAGFAPASDENKDGDGGGGGVNKATGTALTKHSIVAHEMVEYDYADCWADVKAELTERTLKKVERIIPGITENALYIEGATPETLKRYTGNTGGAAYGWAQVPGLRPLKTGISNLHLAGHWEGIGGGVVAAAYSGLKAAKEVE